MFWNLIIMALCILLLLFLLLKEIKRPDKTWLAGRIVATVISMISLACLALPISSGHQQSANGSVVLILLTDGYNKDSVQKIINKNRDAKIFTTDKAIKIFNARYITSVDDIADSFYNNTVHVFGYGLEDNELSQFKNTSLIFHPSVIQNSITSIGWTQEILSGKTLQVQGSFSNTTRSGVKIILNGFDTNLDSVTVAAKQASYFQLTTTPKHIDKAVYSILVLSGNDTLEKEPIPVEVKIARPLNILLLAASPDFENKFLKNWLAENEYKFAVRTTISKNKYEKQYVNISPVSLDRITYPLLEKFDVVIADATELAALPAKDITTIKSYVEEKGLGLIVKADSPANSSTFYLKSFPLIENRDSIQHMIKLNLNDTGNIASPLKIEQPVYIRGIEGTQPLVRDQQMHIVANSKMYALGKIILTTIPNTFSWQLSGNKNNYTFYWSLLLQKAAKKNLLNEVWYIIPAIPQKNEEVDLKLQSIKENIPQVQVGNGIIYMEQNYMLPYEWKGKYWPEKAGWQPLISEGDPPYWLFVYDNKDWKSIKAIEKMATTQKYFNNHMYMSAETSMINTQTISQVPKIYFFIFFILFTGFLWFEKKYINSQ